MAGVAMVRDKVDNGYFLLPAFEAKASGALRHATVPCLHTPQSICMPVRLEATARSSHLGAPGLSSRSGSSLVMKQKP